jgi:hypothetical protein
MSRNLNVPASKDTLTQWVSLSLKKALTESNIRKGFSGTSIWPLNAHIVDSMLGPSQLFSYPLEEETMGFENTGDSSRPGRCESEELLGAPEQAEAAYNDDHD